MDSVEPPLGPYPLPPLRFAYDALTPVIAEASLRRHHAVDHQAEVDRINEWLLSQPQWQGLTIEALLRRLPEIPAADQATVRLHGGGHANHQFFWKILSPVPQAGPTGPLAEAIERDFGGFASFRERFESAAAAHDGPGWAFLVCRPQRAYALEVLVLGANDSVLTLPEPAPGLLICDLWEHAYTDAFGERRADWVRAWWSLVDWAYVGQRLAGVREGRKQL